MTDDVKCPLCGSATEIRTATKGSNVGREFYVCIRYPECKGKVEYQDQDKSKDKPKIKGVIGDLSSDIKWLATFEAMRSQAAPIMSKISKASGGGDEELLKALKEAVEQFPVLMEAMKKIPEPSKEEYRKSREDLLRGIEFYIQGCQSHIKWVEGRNSLYLNDGLTCFNEATKKFDSATNWLTKTG